MKNHHRRHQEAHHKAHEEHMRRHHEHVRNNLGSAFHFNFDDLFEDTFGMFGEGIGSAEFGGGYDLNSFGDGGSFFEESKFRVSFG